MKMFLRGEWVDKAEKIEVRNPYDGSVVDVVPKADPADVDAALAGAVEGAALMRRVPGYERSKFLARAAQLLSEPPTSWAERSARRKARRWPKGAAKYCEPSRRCSFRPKKPSG